MRAFSIVAAASEHPSRVAVRWNTEEYTYSHALHRARAIGQWLSDGGAIEGSAPLAVVGLARLDTLLVLYAAFELRIPVVLLHPRLPIEERQRRMALAGASIVVDETFEQATLPPADSWPESHRAEASALAILFTSGSTGTPRAAVLGRDAFLASARASEKNLGWQDDDGWLLCMPLGHVGGLSVVTRCLAARMPVVLEPWSPDLDDFAARALRGRASILSLVPAQLRMLLDAGHGPALNAARVILIGGAAATRTLLDDAQRYGIRTRTTYGMTETCSQIATAAGSGDTGVGKLLDGVEVSCRDGELCVRGPMLFDGYLGEPSRPREAWFATGDLGRVDPDGTLHILGRKKDLIITGGENVAPREVEDALEKCDGVLEACVFSEPDERWGEVVACALVVHDGFDAGRAAANLSTWLATYQRPRYLALVDKFVLGETGKVDRRATREAARGALKPWLRNAANQ